MKYTVILKSNKAICPVCSGMIVRQQHLVYKCVDCKVRLVVIGLGIFDDEVEMKVDAIQQGSLSV